MGNKLFGRGGLAAGRQRGGKVLGVFSVVHWFYFMFAISELCLAVISRG